MGFPGIETNHQDFIGLSRIVPDWLQAQRGSLFRKDYMNALQSFLLWNNNWRHSTNHTFSNTEEKLLKSLLQLDIATQLISKESCESMINYVVIIKLNMLCSLI